MFIYLLYVPAFILTIILGLLVLLKNRKNLANRFFSYFAFSLALWIFALIFADSIADKEIAIFWNKFAIVGASLLPYTFLIFTYVFPYKEHNFSIAKKILLFIPCLVIISLFPTNFNVKDIVVHDWGAEIIVGPLYYWLLLYFVVYLILAFRRLYLNYKTSSGITRHQILYLFIGLVLAFIFGVFTNLIAIIVDLDKSSVLGPFSALLMIIFISYAMLRYRFLGIRIFFSRSLTYAVILFFILGLCSFLILIFGHFFQDIFQLSFILTATIVAFLVALIFQPIAKLLNEWFKVNLPGDFIGGQESIKKAKEALEHNLELKKLNKKIKKLIADQLKLSGYSLLALSRKNKRFEEVLEVDEPQREVYLFDEDDIFPCSLSLLPGEVIIREEIPFLLEQKKYNSVQREALERINVRLEKMQKSIVLKIVYDNDLIGMIFCGERKNRRAYLVEDIEYLNQLIVEVRHALAIVLIYVEAVERIKA